MSITQRLIEAIEAAAKRYQIQSPNLHWYECLDLATLEVTGGEHHFVELNAFYQQSLTKTPNDLVIAVSKVARELKTTGINHIEARKKAALRFGIEKHEDVKKLCGMPANVKEDIYATLNKHSGRTPARSVSEYVALPSIETLKRAYPEKTAYKLSQLDFLGAPLEACVKHKLEPSVIINEEAFLPVAVVFIDGQKIDHQLPPEMMEFVLEETKKIDFADRKYQMVCTEEDIQVHLIIENVVTDFDSWLKLRNIELPILNSELEEGVIYKVQKVGCLMSDKDECQNKGLQPSEVTGGKCALPTAVVLNDDGKWDLCRLPLDLTDWVRTAVAMAHANMSAFPTRIEFGYLDGRAYAQILYD